MISFANLVVAYMQHFNDTILIGIVRRETDSDIFENNFQNQLFAYTLNRSGVRSEIGPATGKL